MKASWILRLLSIAAVCAAASAASANTGTVAVRFFFNGELVPVERTVQVGLRPQEEAALALVAGPTGAELDAGYRSRIPAGTTVLKLTIAGDSAEIDLSSEVLQGLDEAALRDIFDQFRTTLGDFSDIRSIKLTCGGKLLSSYLAPAPQIPEPAPRMTATSSVGLGGRKICIGPSHGRYWNGSGWYWQRTDPCGLGSVLEDTNSIRLCQFLYQYLTQDGATVTVPRQLDMNDCCNSDTGLAWYNMCASTWLHHRGDIPCSVWASSSGNCGADTATNRNGDDIRARPLFADYTGADIYIAHHTNAAGGTGTETFRDTAMEHPAQEANSFTLATSVNNNVINAIRDLYDSGWTNRGVKDSAGGFGEIRIPNRPACLIELAFHDNCTKDAQYLNDDFFRSVSEWGLYKGVCEYFGVTPTWDKYSDEYVSDTIPSTMLVGQTRNVSVTFRNRGVSWYTSRGFRLGAVGDSDPFTSSTRFNISGEVKPGETYTFNFTLTAPITTGTYTTDWRMVRDGYAWFGPSLTKSIIVVPNDDDQPPTVPTNLRVTGETSSSVSLAWNASTDDYGVLGYTVYRNGVQIATTAGTTYTDAGIADNTTYSYQVDAYDGIPNYSAKCSSVLGTTIAIVFQDGFANMDNWVLDSGVGGNVMPTCSTAQNHGSVAGNGSAYLPAGTAHWVYHDLTPALTASGYKTGTLSAWMYDVSGAASGLRTALRAYVYDSTGSWRSIYWIGASNGNPPNIGTHYIGAVYDGAWNYFDLGSRSTGWHKLAIEVLPYTGSNDLKFYIDGVNTYTASQPAIAADCSIKRIYLGYNYNVNQDTYYDDIMFESSPPAPPASMAGAALSSSSIRWSFSDSADNEIGYRLYDGTNKIAESTAPGATVFDETGLLANTSYTRTIKAYAGSLESPATSATARTLSAPPTSSNVTCDKPTGVWQSSNPFMFTAVGGFGAGKLDHYLIAWDHQPTHAWTGAEAPWSSGTWSQNSAVSASPWYFHMQGYNADAVANGTLDLGPYYFDSTAPSQPVVTDGGDTTGQTLTANWSASDNESGIQEYQYAIGTTVGGTQLLGWTTPSPQNATQFSRSDLSLEAGLTYYISVKARNAAQLWSAVGTSNGIALEAPAVSIAEAKMLADGSDIQITGRVVSGVFDGCFYIQELDRSSGIKVVSTENVIVGQIVDIAGRIQGAGVERYVTATSVH